MQQKLLKLKQFTKKCRDVTLAPTSNFQSVLFFCSGNFFFSCIPIFTEINFLNCVQLQCLHQMLTQEFRRPGPQIAMTFSVRNCDFVMKRTHLVTHFIFRDTFTKFCSVNQSILPQTCVQQPLSLQLLVVLFSTRFFCMLSDGYIHSRYYCKYWYPDQY